HRVVQEGGYQRGGVHAEVGEDLGDRQRVRDKWFAALAHLPAVHVLGNAVCAAQQHRVAALVNQLVGAKQWPQRIAIVGRGPGKQGAQSLGEQRAVGVRRVPGDGATGQRRVRRRGRHRDERVAAVRRRLAARLLLLPTRRERWRKGAD